jgi:hypothetical protein
MMAHPMSERCGAVSPPPLFAVVCNRKKGHRGKHAYVKPSGYVMADWPREKSSVKTTTDTEGK